MENNGYRPMRPECKAEFERLHDRIDKKDEAFDAQERDIRKHEVALARISEDVLHMTKSIGGLTKALWGVAASMLGTLFGFVLWYIQSL